MPGLKAKVLMHDEGTVCMVGSIDRGFCFIQVPAKRLLANHQFGRENRLLDDRQVSGRRRDNIDNVGLDRVEHVGCIGEGGDTQLAGPILQLGFVLIADCDQFRLLDCLPGTKMELAEITKTYDGDTVSGHR